MLTQIEHCRMAESGATETLSERLAAFANALTFTDLPPEAVAEARRVFTNNFCVTIAGGEDPGMANLAAALSPLSGERVASVLGRQDMFDLPTASFLNAAAGNILDYDDTHIPTLIHLGAVIYSPLLSLAETLGLSGREVLTAFAAGAEVACRLGEALTSSHYDRGWHITTTCGGVGAAVAAGKALGLDAGRLSHAIGIAAHSASGLIENLSSPAKSVGVGNAARNGLMAALFAEAGVDSSPSVIEGESGFLKVLSDKPEPECVDQGLGTDWRFLESSSKPYASCILTFPVIDAVLEMRAAHLDRLGEHKSIKRIKVRGHPLLLLRTDRLAAVTPREAKLSLHHSVAVALLRGTAGIPDFLSDAITDADVKALADKVTADPDPVFATTAAQVRIELDTGEVLVARIPHGRGSAKRPLTDDEVRDKCLSVLRHSAPYADAQLFLDQIWDVAEADNLKPTIDRARPPASETEAVTQEPI